MSVRWSIRAGNAMMTDEDYGGEPQANTHTILESSV
jgi:hypothetical protein